MTIAGDLWVPSPDDRSTSNGAVWRGPEVDDPEPPRPREREAVVGGLVEEVPEGPTSLHPAPRPPERPTPLHPDASAHKPVFDGQRVTCRLGGCGFEYTTFRKGEADTVAAAHSAYPRLSIDEGLRLYNQDRGREPSAGLGQTEATETFTGDAGPTYEMPMGPIEIDSPPYPQTPRAAEERAEEGFPEGTRVYVEKYDQRGTVVAFDGIVGGLNPQIIYVAVKLDQGPTYAIDIRDLVRVADLERPDEGRGTIGDLVNRLCEAVEAEEHPKADARLVLIELRRWIEEKWGPEALPDVPTIPFPGDEDAPTVHIDLGRMRIVGPAPHERPGVIDLPATGALSGYTGIDGKPVLDSEVHGNHLAEAIRQDQFQRAVLSQEVNVALSSRVGQLQELLKRVQPVVLERRDAAMEAVEIEDDDQVQHTDALVELANEVAEVLGTAAEEKYERASDFPPDGPDDAEGEAAPPTDPEDTEED